MKNRAWYFLLPVLVLILMNGIVPMMAVFNYALHVVFSGSTPEFVGLANYDQVLHDPDFLGALQRQFIFSVLVLAVQIPLGIMIAMAMPKKGAKLAIVLVLFGLPLLTPAMSVGLTWRLMSADSIGVITVFFKTVFGYNYSLIHPIDAVITMFIVDCWHWIPMVALLCYAGLNAIPDQYYQSAAIDGATPWQTFRYVTLPKLRSVLIIAVLLRFMDSFMIYAEPYIMTGGGPGNYLTYLNVLVARRAESYELGFAGAASILYLFFVLLGSYIFFQLMTSVGKVGKAVK